MYKKYNRILGNALADSTFNTQYGKAQNLRELRNLLYKKGKVFYRDYVTEEDNHFANWIENIFGDEELAHALRNANSFGQTIKLIEDRVKYLSLWLSFNKNKETLTKYLVKNLPYDKDFEPSHHKFETLSDYDKVSEINKPPVLKNKPIAPPRIERPPERIMNEEALLQQLEYQYPGINLAGKTPEPKKSFFSRFFKKK